MSRVKSLIYMVIGFLISLPWAINAFSDGHEVYMSFASFCYIVMAIVGIPMFFRGLIDFIFAGKTSIGPAAADTSAIDLARIRHVVETEHMRGKK